MKVVHRLFLMSILLLSIFPASLPSSQQRPLLVVFSSDSFTNINRNDALASAKAWIEAVGHRRGFELGVTVDTYETIEELQQLVHAGGADLFIMNSAHYLALEKERDHFDPVFAPQQGASLLREYILLTRKDSHKSIEELGGGQVIFFLGKGAYLGRMWLDGELVKKGFPTSNEYFSVVTEATKPSSAVLPVFFGKADACVVDRASFEVMRELNPQIGVVLDACITSPPYLETVICIHKNYVNFRDDLLEGLAELHKDPAGHSLLTVFKMDELVAFDEEMMNSVRTLTNDRQQGIRGTAQ